MDLLSEFLQYAISGITSGSIYAIVGICWSIVFLISGVLNFATGEFVMLGGMLTWLYMNFGIPLPLAAFLAIFSTVLISMILERLVIRPIRYPSEASYILITIAAAAVIKGLILISCGSETRHIDAFVQASPIKIFEATLVPQVLIVIGALVLVTASLLIFLNKTLLGKALRASSINQTGATLVGINISKVRLFCFGLAGGLGALAGLVTTPITFTGYNIGILTSLKGLVVAIVGGWSIGGTVIAGVFLGLIEGFGAGFISSGWKDAIALSVMILFLICQTFSFTSMRKSKVKL